MILRIRNITVWQYDKFPNLTYHIAADKGLLNGDKFFQEPGFNLSKVVDMNVASTYIISVVVILVDSNYEITCVPGTLTVKARSKPVSVTPTPTTSPSGDGGNSGGGYPSGGGGFPGGGFSGGPAGGGNNQPTVTPSVTPTVTPTVKPTATPTPLIAPVQESTASAPSIGKVITDKKSKTSYTITESTDNKKEVAFIGTNEDKSNLVIPTSIKIDGEEYKVTSIERKALYNNKDLKFVTIGKNITEIKDYAFAKCSGLTQVSIGNNVTDIDASAFASCVSLSSITFGSNIETLGKNIFYGDKNLKKIIIKSTKLKEVDEKAFNNISGDITIYVPASKYDEYKELLKNKGLKKTVKIRRLKE